MYASLVLDASELRAEPPMTSMERKHLRECAKIVLKYCLIAAGDAAYSARLAGSVSKLPLDLQAVWVEIIKANLARRGPVDIDSLLIDGCSSGCPATHERIDLVLTSNKSLAHTSCAACAIEYERLEDLQGSVSVARAAALRSSSLLRGRSRTDEFEKRLGLVLRNSGRVTILDRYAASSLIRSGAASGVEWFLDNVLNQGVTDLVLISGFGSTVGGKATTLSQARAAVEGCAARLRANGGRPVTVRLVLFKDRYLGKVAHDRFVSVVLNGSALTVSVGKGLDSFADKVFGQSYTFALQVDDVIDDFMQSSKGKQLLDVTI